MDIACCNIHTGLLLSSHCNEDSISPLQTVGQGIPQFCLLGTVPCFRITDVIAAHLGNWPQCMIFTPDGNRILIRFEKYLIYDPVWILFPDIPHILVFFRLTQGQAVCNHLHVITQTIILSRRTERKAGFVRRATGQCRPAPSTGAALSSNVPPCIRLPARPRCHHCCRQQRPPPAGCRHPHWTAQCQPARPGSWPRRYSCPQ